MNELKLSIKVPKNVVAVKSININVTNLIGMLNMNIIHPFSQYSNWIRGIAPSVEKNKRNYQ